jgi:gliding motility-associated-like protein
MRRIFLIIFLHLILIGAALQADAQTPVQTCNGSLGDPIFTQDFGSGQNPGPQLQGGYTNMTYTTSNCPDDGFYTIANSITGSGNCHQETWHNVTSDHTGNPNGYMMIVNASYASSVFFTQTAPTTLCPNTTYYFSAYILNLIKAAAANGGGYSEPNILFSVETTDGTVLNTSTTNTIEPTDSPTWVQKGVYFTTSNNDLQNVVVKMTNLAPGGTGNDLILDDITFKACGPVINAGFGSAGNSNPPILCQGYDASYNLTASVQGDNPSYQWQSYHSIGGWTDTLGQNSNTLTVNFKKAVPGTYQYRVGIANGSAITSAGCRVYSAPLVINCPANPVAEITGPTTPVCEGDTISLYATGGVNYLWSGPNISGSENPLVIKGIKLSDAGKYTVIGYSQYSCASAPVFTPITVNAQPVGTVSGGGNSICIGDGATLTASGGAAYSWSPAAGLPDPTAASILVHPADTTTYTVKIYSAAGCTVTKTATVNVLKKPIANAGSNKVIIEGQSVRLTASAQNGDIFYWTPNFYISNLNILNPIVSPTQDMTYTLHVTSTENCGIDSSKVFVRVYKHVEIPNSFSPNGDGVNDLWNIGALSTYPNSLLQVFNRYGQQVFQSIGYTQPWDGRYNGSPLPIGTYYYVLDLKNNTPKLSGWVMIVR